MKVSLSPIYFKSDYKKGQEEFNKLSKTEQAGRIGAERARRNYNQNHFPPLSKPKGDLGEYVSRQVSIERTLKKVLERFKFKK